MKLYHTCTLINDIFIFVNDSIPSLLLAILAIIAFVFAPIAIILFFYFRQRKIYRAFVYKHSIAFTELIKLNELYIFKDIKNFNMVHDYDNESFYRDISPADYLIYQLIFIEKQVEAAMKDTAFNKELYGKYEFSVKGRCIRNCYDVEELPKNKRLLSKIEEQLLLENIQKPTIEFKIKVTLQLCNINGEYKRKKSQTFYAGDIKLFITKLNNKNGRFYEDREIWDAICRVERGKVTNRMRFAIYERDNNCCVKCGSKSHLEIDHIIPIAKGGKSSFDNLQTLCHRCNVKKGMEIEEHE